MERIQKSRERGRDARRWVEERAKPVDDLHEFLHAQFEPQGFTDTAYDRMVAVATGFLKTSLRNRGPYRSTTPEDVQIVREWLRKNFPEMLKLP